MAWARRASAWLGRRLTSARLTMVLIAAAAVLCVLGLVLPQAPGSDFGSQAYSDWVGSLGPWAQLPGVLGFLDVFGSPWFMAIAALLGLNCIACMTKRMLRRRARAGSLDERGHGVTAHDAGRLPARRGVLGRAGPYVLHMSLIIVLVGIVVALLVGFQEPFFVVSEGSQRAVGRDTGLDIRLDSVQTDYWPDGSFREFRSLLEVVEDGRTRSGTVSVNHPLSVAGVRLFQAGVGPAPEILVEDAAGRVLFRDTVPLTGVFSTSGLSRPSGAFRIESLPLDVHVVGPAMNAQDAAMAADELGLEFFEPGSSTSLGWMKLTLDETASAADLSFTYADARSFSVFRVTKDPGRLVVWCGCGLFVVGLVLSLFFRRARGRGATMGSRDV